MDTISPHETQTLASWQEGVVSSDISAVEDILQKGLQSEDKVPMELSERLVEAGGKRIRPLLMCLVYRALENHPEFSPRGSVEDLHTLGAVAEWVHTATLFHDDVLDNSPTRRNLSSAHILEGNKTAILVGDFVYAEAFARLMATGHVQPSQRLANTIKRLVEGELWQHRYSQTRNIVKNEYLKVIEAKTAALFAWATQSGAWISGVPVVQSAYDFGKHLGIAFQIADDFIDTFSLDTQSASDEEVLEWALSAPPLPLILASEKVPSICKQWRELVSNKSPQEIRKSVAEILGHCRQEDVLEESEQWLGEHLSLARESHKILGAPAQLHDAINLLEFRGKDGLKLARKKAYV